MDNQDKQLLEKCVSNIEKGVFNETECDTFPLDKEVITVLKELNSKLDNGDDDYELFRYRDTTDKLWSLLLEKSIICLRYYDKREPFSSDNTKSKKPKAYGINELNEYYKKYSEFERVLYGSGKYYRDHVIHVFRTWLVGVSLLTKNNGEYLDRINILEKHYSANLNRAEKISIWTIIALTHDLGYPLEKAKGVINVTHNMISTFISNPDISMDFSFHGVQNYMNDFVVRLMSSKMRLQNENKENEELTYVARLQPKYYFKFQKSLEKNSHGILSTLIIYKLLTYFLESDYNINEDYTFNEEDCRQFYIRREILRSIAAHTCDDVYQLYMNSFAFLLRICDDSQEWGRKYISELYVKSGQTYELNDIIFDYDNQSSCTVNETISLSSTVANETLLSLISRFKEQALTYITILRDGQDTIIRDFSFEKTLNISLKKITVHLTLDIPRNNASTLKGKIDYCSDGDVNSEFDVDFFASKLPLKKLQSNKRIKFTNRSGKEALKNDPTKWAYGYFELILS